MGYLKMVNSRLLKVIFLQKVKNGLPLFQFNAKQKWKKEK